MRLQFLFLNVHALQIHGRFQSGAAASYVYERRSLQRSLDARNTRLNHRRTGHWGRVEDLPHHRRTPSSEDSPPSAPHHHRTISSGACFAEDCARGLARPFELRGHRTYQDLSRPGAKKKTTQIDLRQFFAWLDRNLIEEVIERFCGDFRGLRAIGGRACVFVSIRDGRVDRTARQGDRWSRCR